MPTCYVCGKIAFSINKLIYHFKVTHRIQSLALYRCKEGNCTRSFSNLNSFRKHFIAKHFCETKEIKKNPIFKVDQSGNDNFALDEHNLSSFTSQTPATQLEHATFDVDALKSKLLEKTLEFICRLYDESILNRKQVQNIVTQFKGFLSLCLDFASESILKIQGLHALSNFKEHFFSVITSVKSIFNDLDTEHKRFKVLTEQGLFIEPMEVIVGQRLEKVGNKTIQKDVNLQFIPPDKILKKLFELPDVYTNTIKHMKTLNSCTDNVISNIIQSDYWKEKTSALKSDIVLPILLYYDEYETGNPLGAHAGIHKLGAVYFSIPCLPVTEEGSVNNIFLTMLFHSSDLYEFGNQAIFFNLLDSLNQLESKGIAINVSDELILVKFCIAFIIGDNLGLHTILGFSESFRANFFCRFCKCHRNETQVLCYENVNLLRNESNYTLDLEVNDVSKTGIKSFCIWNNIKSFEVTNNLAVDVMHDIFEGVGGYDMVLLIDQFINKDKFFTLKILNSRIKYFTYGFEIKNKPCLISSDNLKTKCLKMSASEMKYFILCFGLMVGNLIPVGNKHWELYLKLREIVCLISSRHITVDDHKLLEVLISEHHTILVELFKVTLKPKHHHMVHYPRIMKNVGPLIHMSSMRFESKHRLSKLAANVVASRVNISKTLAIKNQLKFCNRLLSKKGILANVTCGASTELHSIFEIIPNFDTITAKLQKYNIFRKNVISTKQVSINSTRYNIHNSIYINVIDGKPIFGKISHIFLSTMNEILFMCKPIHIYSFNNHLQAFKVQISNSIDEIFPVLQSELMHYAPLITTLADDCSYIALY